MSVEGQVDMQSSVRSNNSWSHSAVWKKTTIFNIVPQVFGESTLFWEDWRFPSMKLESEDSSLTRPTREAVK